MNFDAEDILIESELYGINICGRFKDESRSKIMWLTGLELLKLKNLLGGIGIAEAEKLK